MKIKTTIAAAVIGALSLAGAVPAHASTADACQIMGPYYVQGARDCACLIAALLTSQDVCSR